MKEYKSPYRHGADDGAWFGLYLAALFYSSALSYRFPLLGTLTIVLVVSVPLVVYLTLRRTYIQESRTTSLSSLWMQGIIMFLCGSAIAGAASVVYMKWVNPTYINDVVTMTIDLYRASPDQTLVEIADGLQRIMDAGALPTPISMVFTSIWTSVLTGSILSLILGLIIRGVYPASSRRRNEVND